MLLREMVDLRIRLPTVLVNTIIYLDTLAECQYSRNSTLAHRWATTMSQTYYSLARAEDAEEELGLLVPSIVMAIGDACHRNVVRVMP
jgi:hypothetical protein